jgi:hypothetical protein
VTRIIVTFGRGCALEACAAHLPVTAIDPKPSLVVKGTGAWAANGSIVMKKVLGRKGLGAICIAVIGAVVLASCGVSCTAVGCGSGISVVAPRTVRGGAVRRMRICVDRRCTTATAAASSGGDVQASALLATRSLPSSHRVAVSVVLEGTGNSHLATASGEFRLQKRAPNGVACGPICYYSSVSVQTDGALSEGGG